jgi:hypothetical protein
MENCANSMLEIINDFISSFNCMLNALVANQSDNL